MHIFRRPGRAVKNLGKVMNQGLFNFSQRLFISRVNPFRIVKAARRLGTNFHLIDKAGLAIPADQPVRKTAEINLAPVIIEGPFAVCAVVQYGKGPDLP